MTTPPIRVVEHKIHPLRPAGQPRTTPDGSRVVEGDDGARLEGRPVGHHIQQWVTGEVYESFAVGRALATDRYGHRVETLPDGRRML